MPRFTQVGMNNFHDYSIKILEGRLFEVDEQLNRLLSMEIKGKQKYAHDRDLIKIGKIKNSLEFDIECLISIKKSVLKGA